MKILSIQELVEGGYLQEVNRCFFHPLGLALVVGCENAERESFIVGVMDMREDPEGILFPDEVLSNPEFISRALKVRAEWEEKARHRNAFTNLARSVQQPNFLSPPKTDTSASTTEG